MSGRRLRWGPFAARAALTLAVLGALAAWLPTDALFAAMGRAGAGLWLAVLLGFAAGHALAALKWGLLLRAAGFGAARRELLRAHAAGLFANLCLPSLVGGDLVRAGMLARVERRPEALVVAGAGDRVIDAGALLMLAALGGALVPGALDATAAHALGGASLLLACGVGGALWLARALDPGRLPAAAGRVLGRLRGALDALLARPRASLAAGALALGIQAAFVGLNALLGGAVGIELPFSAWLLAWPLAKLAALVPISLGGIGVREVALAALLLPFGVAPTLAVAQSLLWETLLVTLGLLAGGASLWMGRGVR